MKVVTSTASPHEFTGSALVVTVHADDALSGSVVDLDASTNGFFRKQLDAGAISTKPGKVSVFHQVDGISADCVVVVGAGKKAEIDQGRAFRCAGTAAKELATRERAEVGFHFGNLPADILAAAIAGSMNGMVGQDLFRADRNLYPCEKIEWLDVAQTTAHRGQAIGEGMLLTRELVNLPPNHMYPEAFAKRAAVVAISSGLELEVWDELRLRRERCNALLAVASGSAKPPRLLILRYPGKKKQAPIALVGKGVTFDSGGLSLKPSEGMLNMKCDMAGAATVLGCMQSISALQVDAPVVALVGLVENMISAGCYRLGDVLTARSGKTVEIHNTDAEGRLVLADVLNVALEEKPSHIVDLATLTGACLVALGTDIAGLMSNDPTLESNIRKAAETAGEDVWPLPMLPHFAEQIQSKVADIRNVGEGRWGGAITAAKFLEEFVGTTPWTHIDIAGPAFCTSPKPYMDAGGSGAMLRTLVSLIENL